jgi:hypothetical protein
MADLTALEEQGKARRVLRAAYWEDVQAVARQFIQRVRSGEYDPLGGPVQLDAHLSGDGGWSARQRPSTVGCAKSALDT